MTYEQSSEDTSRNANKTVACLSAAMWQKVQGHQDGQVLQQRLPTGGEVSATKGHSPMTTHSDRCFACDKPLGKTYRVTCSDDQQPFVGRECFRHIKAAGSEGWQPPKGGPRLYMLPDRFCQARTGRRSGYAQRRPQCKRRALDISDYCALHRYKRSGTK